jgi:hypothetical protein
VRQALGNVSISMEERHERRHRPWFLVPWVLLVFAVLFACGQLALHASLPEESGDTRSQLRADYAPWAFMPMAPLDPSFLLQVASDLGWDGLPPIATAAGCLLPGSGCAWFSSPTPTPAFPATATNSDGGGGGGATQTVGPTPTLGAAWPTLTPSEEWNPPPVATNSPDTPTPLPPTPTTPPTLVPPTPTTPPTPCSMSGCEPDIGTPDGSYQTFPPGTETVFNLSSPIVVDGTPEPEWDLVYFERTMGGYILLDLVVVRIGVSATGDWYMVFDWGDNIPDTNTNVATYAAGGEVRNEYIPQTDLYGTPALNTGIAIDVDIPSVPAGEYSWLSIVAPTPPSGSYPPGDWTEVDAVEVLPTPTP